MIDSRYTTLGIAFDEYWNNALHTTDQKYFSQMALKDLVQLKNAIHNIHNIVTLMVTDGFIGYLVQHQFITLDDAKRIHTHVDQTHANANGFDIEDATAKIVAEVKCNIPARKNAFGASQEKSIRKDIIHLQDGKNKSKISEQALRDCYKFMVLLDYEDVRKCMQKLIVKLNNEGIKVQEYNPNNTLPQDKDTVYVVYIDAEKQYNPKSHAILY